MAHTIKISDGTTTCDFLGSNYKILTGGGWAPRTAKRRQSVMGGQSPYEDVVETMAIQVKGTSVATCLSKVAALSDLLDQAAKWNQNDAGVTAVYMEYEPNGSALAASVKALIVGPPGYGDFITMPNHYTYLGQTGAYLLGTVSDPIVVSFTRRGLWRGATEAKAAAASTGNPDIVTTAAFTDTPKIPVPYDMDIDFIGRIGEASGGADFYALTTNAADKLYTIECEVMTGGAATVVALASAGNVHRQSDAGTATFSDTTIAMNANARLYAFYICVKASATVTKWTLTAYLYPHATTLETVAQTRPIIYGGSTAISIVSLGTISTNWTPARLVVTAVPSANLGETLDLDYICGIALDENANIFHVIPAGTAFASCDRVVVAQQLATKKTPLVTALEAAAIVAYSGYEGNAAPYASGNSLSALVFGTQTGNYTVYDADTGGGQKADVTFTATRTMGYLTPL